MQHCRLQHGGIACVSRLLQLFRIVELRSRRVSINRCLWHDFPGRLISHDGVDFDVCRCVQKGRISLQIPAYVTRFRSSFEQRTAVLVHDKDIQTAKQGLSVSYQTSFFLSFLFDCLNLLQKKGVFIDFID